MNRNNWNWKKPQFHGDCDWSSTYYDYEGYELVYDLDNDGPIPPIDIMLALDGNGCDLGAISTHWDQLAFTNSNTANYYVDELKEIPVFKKLFEFYTGDISTKFVIKLNDEGTKQGLITKISNLTGDPIKQVENVLIQTKYPDSWSTLYKRILFDLFFDELYDNVIKLDQEKLVNVIEQDYSYGSDSSSTQHNDLFSKLESQQNFVKNKLDLSIDDFTNLTIPIGNVIDFSTTMQNWKKFTFLDSQENLANFQLVKMFFTSSQTDQDFTTFADPLNQYVSLTHEGAEELKMKLENPYWQKQTVVYNINGELIGTLDSSRDYESLKKDIKLDYRYLSKKELINYANNDKNWDDVISDGIYSIYQFVDKNGTRFSFKSYEGALKMYENAILNTDNIQTIVETKYIYSIMLNNELKKYEWSSEEELINIAHEIFDTLKETI